MDVVLLFSWYLKVHLVTWLMLLLDIVLLEMMKMEVMEVGALVEDGSNQSVVCRFE